MSGKSRNIYLGRRVKDTGKKGLDNLREVLRDGHEAVGIPPHDRYQAEREAGGKEAEGLLDSEEV